MMYDLTLFNSLIKTQTTNRIHESFLGNTILQYMRVDQVHLLARAVALKNVYGIISQITILWL